MKKVLHTMLDCFYKNGFGYQENILPAKHKQLGFDVHIVTYNQGRDASYKANPPITYTNPDGIPVHVLDTNKSPLRHIPVVIGWTNTTIGLYELLEDIRPDIIFIHGLCIYDNLIFIRYKQRHPDVKLFADNHSDYYNTPVKLFKQKIYRYGVGRYVGKRLGAVAEKVWGVTPWRVDYLKDVYDVTESKVDLLVMGGDETKINWNGRDTVRHNIRESLAIPQDAFLVITGGKIDKAKNIHLLIEAVKSISNGESRNAQASNDIHLLIFGRTEPDMQEYFAQYETVETKSEADNIHYIGWIDADKAYDYFLASDLACFPGTHSVLWEQACACGLPAIFKDWNGGFSHVDLGGNCILLKNINIETISDSIGHIVSDRQTYNNMKKFSETKVRKAFSYITIAQKAINFIEP